MKLQVPNEADIIYRDFWDVPRIFIVRHRDQLYLFDCRFDDSTEDFVDSYQVYRLPELSEDVLQGSWEGLAEDAERYLGEVPTGQIKFDASLRCSIETGIVDELEAKGHGDC